MYIRQHTLQLCFATQIDGVNANSSATMIYNEDVSDHMRGGGCLLLHGETYQISD